MTFPHNPVFGTYAARKQTEGKPKRLAKVATAHKANRVLYRLMCSGEDYDLSHHLAEAKG